MELAIQREIEVNELKENLERAFPNYKIKYAPLNKKTLRVIDGMNQVVVGTKKQKLIYAGNINMMDLRILIPFILLMGLFVIGGVVFAIVMMQIKKKDYKAMEEEIGNHIASTIIHANHS
ncbi:hypothetical protein [Flagellimonas eckloniae]|uniref:Histidine kinase n=1 Tax=Flagellimonas eckloniae TaxID=346185 RepID=A0A0Q1C123_9FLAO|nr:hypothetical protein [Allomuricauda eckloniae]KQC30880.1 hypothetical protein AAY42_14020 [Allomuricauda eckloniae]